MKRRKHANPIARALRSPHLQAKVVPDKKTVYNRKKQAPINTGPELFLVA